MKKDLEGALASVLADTYVLAVMTQNYHWNVEGRDFAQLHTLFEQQYTELFTAIDEIAERLRALGAYAPGTLKEFLLLSSVTEDKKRPDAKGMISRLRDAHRQVAKSADHAKALATKAKDDETQGMMVERITLHEKQAWMLSSLLK